MKSEGVEQPTLMPTPVGLSSSMIAQNVDPWMAGALVGLLGVGTVLVYSASAVRAHTGGSEAFLLRHLSSVAIGLLLVCLTLRVRIDRWSRAAYPLLVVTVILLLLVYVPGVGRRINGAARWIALGPLSFQPGELAKLSVVVYLAHSLAKKRDRAQTFSVGFLPHVLVTSGLAFLILFQPDIGTSAVIYGVLGLMLFVAGTRIGYLVLAFVAAIPVGIYYVSTRPHAWARLLVFLNPEPYKRDIGYQIWESILTFGSGGLWGRGLGAGQQKLYFLPEPHTDFIFAVLGQELGFLGVVLVIALFSILVGRGLWIASKMPRRFSTFLCFGIVAWIGVQALINMAVVLALLPTKGLTLPFISYGRSSVVVCMLSVGILLRASAELKICRAGDRAPLPRSRVDFVHRLGLAKFRGARS